MVSYQEGSAVSPRIESYLTRNARPFMRWQEPCGFDLADTVDNQKLEDLMAAKDVSVAPDILPVIADDLFELNHPDKINDDEARARYSQEVIEQGPAYGRWFLFPWDNTLVQYPELSDLRALRTSRNRHLISDEEQLKLYDSRVAIIGLSVGSNVLREVLRSGIGGHIAISDMDTLAPSNLNRVDGFFEDVGTKKLDLAAARISKTDPYISQEHYGEGINKQNISALAEAGNVPDVLVDEIDDLPSKAMLRLFAREHNIPLVMATDTGDKSLLDVERYDLGKAEPFHGKIKDKDLERLATGEISDEERGKFMLKIVGVKNVSTRLLRSAKDIGENLGGLPQLSTSAAASGVLASLAMREIILGRELSSGRYDLSPKHIMKLQNQASGSEFMHALIDFIRK